MDLPGDAGHTIVVKDQFVLVMAKNAPGVRRKIQQLVERRAVNRRAYVSEDACDFTQTAITALRLLAIRSAEWNSPA